MSDLQNPQIEPQQASQHVPKKQQFLDLLEDLKALTTKNNVSLVIELIKWTKEKIPLIEAAEIKKNAAKRAKAQGLSRDPTLKVSRGEIWEAKLGYNVGSEEGETRPVLIIQNDHNNKISPNTIIAPITKVPNRFRNYKDPLSPEQIADIRSQLRPTEVLILSHLSGGKTKLKYSSILYCQNIRELSKERLTFKSGKIDEELWSDVNTAICYSLGI